MTALTTHRFLGLGVALLATACIGCGGSLSTEATEPPPGSIDSPRLVQARPPTVVDAGRVRSEPDEEDDSFVEELGRERSLQRANFLRLARVLNAEAAERCGGDEAESCSVTERDGYVFLNRAESGNGVYGSWDSTTWIHRPIDAGGEWQMTYTLGGMDGAYVTRPHIGSAPGVDAEALLALSEGTTLARDAGHPSWGLAQLFVSTDPHPRVRSGRGFRVLGPLYLAGAKPAGALECTSASVTGGSDGYTPETLIRHSAALVGFAVSFEEEDEAAPMTPEQSWVRVAPVNCPPVDVHVGPYELRTHRLFGRNSGTAVALHRAGDADAWRGEWVLETRNALLGTTIDWLGAHQGWIFGRTDARHPGEPYADAGALFAIRAPDGVAVRIDVPPVYEDGLRDRDGDFDREEAVDDCAQSRVHDSDDADEWRDAMHACEALVPRVDQVELTPSLLRVQRTEHDWSEVSLAELMRVLRHVPSGRDPDTRTGWNAAR